MRHILGIILLGTILLTACKKNNQKNGVLMVSKQGFEFSSEQIFDKVIVEEVIASATDEEKDLSESLLEEAKAQLSKETTPEGLESLTLSLLNQPSAEGYFLIGKYEKDSLPEQAIKAFDLAEELNYLNKGELYFHASGAYAKLGNMEKAQTYLDKALKGGFSDTEALLSDAALSEWRGTSSFMEVYDSNFTNESLPILDVFKSSFPEVGLPFSIDVNHLNTFDHSYKTMSFAFEAQVPEIQEALYSGVDGDDYVFIGKLGRIAEYDLVAYGGYPVNTTKSPTYYMLATYDDEGNQVDRLLFAGKEDWQSVRVGSIDEFYKIQVDELDVEIESKDNTPDNRITSSTITKHSEYILTPDGKFEALK